MSILITGSNGFLGKHVVELYPDVYGMGGDLRNKDTIQSDLEFFNPDTIIHLAADIGGLTYNLDNSASIFYNNVIMNTELINAAAQFGVRRFVFISSVCAYPQNVFQPTRPHHLWTGFPEESNGSYGISKRIALTQLEACKKSYGMDFEYLILANLYGPGDKSNHVIPDLLRKFLANPETVDIWGDGSQSRDFLYVEDAARAIKHFADNPLGEPVNIANGLSQRFNVMVDSMCRLTDYKGTIVYDHTKPIGEIARSYNVAPAKQHGFETQVSFEEGLKETIEWMKEND